MPHRRPPRAAVRRRRRAVALLAGVALVAGVVVGATTGGGGDGSGGSTAGASGPLADRTGGSGAGAAGAGAASQTPAARARVAALGAPLDKQVGDLLIISFSGTTAPAYVLDALHGGRAAGVILFGANAPSAASVRALTTSLQRAAGGDAVICLDQEGGEIRTVAFAPSNLDQADQTTPAIAAREATATATAERAAGVNVTLGPVADVASVPNSVMDSRAYPGDATAVSKAVQAATAAYERAGVAPVLKHFPGLGATTANTDDASATIDRTKQQLVNDLAPYRATSAPLVMVGHARYPALDPDHIASQSPAIVTGLLRDQLGFSGVTMTDSMEARAVANTGSLGRAAVRAVDAGEDLLLLTGPGSFPIVRDALLNEARHDPAFKNRVAQAAARVAALRATLPHPRG